MARSITTKVIIATVVIAVLVFILIAHNSPQVVGQPTLGYDDISVVARPSYERSLRPIYRAGTVPFRDIATMTPPDALRFYQGTADATPQYHPQFQRFIARNDASIGFSMPSYPGEFVRVGFVYSKSDESLRLPLFGRPTYPGGNRFEYYVLDDTRHANPIGLNNYNGLELETDNVVGIPGYRDRFFVYIY